MTIQRTDRGATVSDIGSNFRASMQDLKRRKVFRVGASYALVAWIIIAGFYAPLHFLLPVLVLFITGTEAEPVRRTLIRRALLDSAVSLLVAFAIAIFLVRQGYMLSAMMVLLLAMGVFYIFLFRGQRKDRQRHADMLANLKRNDRVQTIGGVIGSTYWDWLYIDLLWLKEELRGRGYGHQLLAHLLDGQVANTGVAEYGKTPLEVEKRLVRLTPEEFRKDAHHWLILHGRYVCKARKPLCGECPIVEWCEYRNKELP